jgi:hypothetical protein
MYSSLVLHQRHLIFSIVDLPSTILLENKKRIGGRLFEKNLDREQERAFIGVIDVMT